MIISFDFDVNPADCEKFCHDPIFCNSQLDITIILTEDTVKIEVM
jgi:hypothetical protein